MNYIEVKNASVIYNEHSDNEMQALIDVSLRVEEKEFVIFFGPSGCGKTTLLNLISGLERPSRGGVYIEGKDISTFDADRMARFHCDKIGMIFQAYNLIPSLSVIDNVILPRVFGGDSDLKGRKQRAHELLEKFGVAAQADKYPAQLSGGQQQRIGIARSLINEQPIILADEPVGNLDSKSAENVLQLLRELNQQEGKTIIMVTHNAEHLVFADHVFYLRDGRIIDETFNHKQKKVRFQDLKPEEKEFELLSRSFAGLSEAQMNILLVPFKAKALAAYLTSALDFNQNQRLEELIAKRLSGELNEERLCLFLDKPRGKGGVGLDFRTAKDYASVIESFVSNVGMLSLDLKPLAGKLGLGEEELRAKLIVRHLATAYLTEASVAQLKAFERIVLERLRSTIDNEELLRLLDLSSQEGGMGLEIRLARKIAWEMEMLLLLRFSQTGQATSVTEPPKRHGRNLRLIAEDLRHIEEYLKANS